MIWTGFLVWLAKTLIQYFLQTNLQLQQELDASLKRKAEHENLLIELRRDEMKMESDIHDKQRYLTDLYYDMTQLNKAIVERDKEYEDKKLEAEKRISELSDSDVVRAEL